MKLSTQQSTSKRGFLATLLLILVLCLSTANVVNAQEDAEGSDPKNWYKQAKQNYESLPDQGKFATGAVCGFGASKLVVNSAVKFVKFAGAAFIATEVLEAVGVIDVDELVSDQQSESMRKRVMNRLGDVKRTVTNLDLKEMVKDPKQKAGALGIAAGALVGFWL